MSNRHRSEGLCCLDRDSRDHGVFHLHPHMYFIYMAWWRHQMETFSALLAFCEWNPITGHRWITLTKPVKRTFDVFFDVHLNNWLSKQSRRRWFETPLRSLWRHCNGAQRIDYRLPLLAADLDESLRGAIFTLPVQREHYWSPVYPSCTLYHVSWIKLWCFYELWLNNNES